MSSSSHEFEDYKTQIVKDFRAKRFKEVHERTDEMIKKFGHSWFTDRHIFYALYFPTDSIDGCESLRTLAYNLVFVKKYPEALEEFIILPIACKEAHHKGQSAEALAMLKDRKPYLEKELAESSEKDHVGDVISEYVKTIEEIENKLREDSLEAEKQLLEAVRQEEINKKKKEEINKKKKEEINKKKKEKNKQKKERRKEREKVTHAEAIAQEAKVDQEEAIVEASPPVFEQIVIEMGPCLSVLVERKDITNMFHGQLISGTIWIKDISLIPYENNVFETYKRLQGEGEDFKLTQSWVVDGSVVGESKLLLTPRMYLVTDFFKKEHTKLMESGRLIGFKNWWTHIEGSFKNVFRNVVKAMLILFPKHHSIGDEIFVTQIGNVGKVIPVPMLKMKKDVVPVLEMKKDVEFFMRTIVEIMNIPFENSNNISQLPQIVKHYLEELRRIKWNASVSTLDIQLGVHCLYFLNAEERIRFLRNLGIVVRAYDLYHVVDDNTVKCNEFHWISNWWELIPTGTRYSEIYQYLIGKAKMKGKPQYYQKPGGILRFTAAVFHHHNDKLKDGSKFKTEEQLERDLSEMFPELYETLDYVIRQARKTKTAELDWEELFSLRPPSN